MKPDVAASEIATSLSYHDHLLVFEPAGFCSLRRLYTPGLLIPPIVDVVVYAAARD